MLEKFENLHCATSKLQLQQLSNVGRFKICKNLQYINMKLLNEIDEPNKQQNEMKCT